MEGKPRFSGAAPESDQSVGPEVSQWRERLGESPWAGTPSEPTPKTVEPVQAAIAEVQPVDKQAEAIDQKLQEPAEEPKAAIDEALTDSKADIADVQAMMGHFFEANKDV